MKQLLSVGMFAFAASTVSAVPIVEEPFAYEVGDSLIGKSPAPGFTWGSQAPAAADDLIFDATSLSPTAPYTLPSAFPAPSGAKARIGGSGRTYVLPIGAPASTTMYYSMLIDVHSLNNSSTVPAILSGFANVSGTTNPTAITATLYGKHGLVEGTYQLGIGRNSNSANATFGSDIPLTDAVFVVAAVEIVEGTSNDIARLWINPDVSTFGDASAPTATLEGQNVGGDASINSFILYQRGTNNGLAVLGSWVDEVKIGTTWADVTPVPEPASLGLIGLGMAGLLRRQQRRRRRT